MPPRSVAVCSLVVGALLVAAVPAHADQAIMLSNGKCLDVHGPDFDARTNGGRVQAWDCHGGPNQQWHWKGASLVSANGKCLDVHGPDFDSRGNGGRIQMWDCHGGPNQRWRHAGKLRLAPATLKGSGLALPLPAAGSSCVWTASV